MSDSKRTGGRDISELKQRLGLRKGATTSGTQARGNGAPSQGISAPPGMNLPPPPGMAQPQQPAGPVIPNAADDPFGAMNAMAHIGTVQRAPEIVIVNDGKPVENVSAGSRAAMIAKFALPAIAALVIGLGVGRQSQQADSFNEGLRGIRAIQGNVKELKRALSSLDTALDEAKGNYHPDPALDKTLETLAQKLTVSTDQVFAARQTSGNDALAGQMMAFYAGVDEVKGMVDGHVHQARNDDIGIKAGKAKADAATIKPEDNPALGNSLRYAILTAAPTEADKNPEFGAKLVEIGPVYCANAAQYTENGKCKEGEQVTSYAYRTEPSGAWTKGDLATGGGDTIPAKKIVPLVPTTILTTVIQDPNNGVSDVLYGRRLRAIAERTKLLIEDGNKLEAALQVEASKGDRFSYFL